MYNSSLFFTPSPQLRARHNPLERRPEPWVYSVKRCEVATTSKSNKIRQKNLAVKIHCLRSAQIKTERTVKSNQIKPTHRTIKTIKQKTKQNTSKDPPSGTLVGRRSRHGKSMASHHSVQINTKPRFQKIKSSGIEPHQHIQGKPSASANSNLLLSFTVPIT